MVKAGDVVKVRVVEVDVKRKRIALTMRKDGGGDAPPPRGGDRGKPVNPKLMKTDTKPSQAPSVRHWPRR